MERKLAAIFSADVQGYSRLMGENEEVTIMTLMAYRAVMTELIEGYRGRVVDTPGDNLLAEFNSVVDAMQCAVAIQDELQERNATLPPNRTMVFRIGINLGDVVVDGERIYGEGVNLAARLEGLAEGGGICISGPVYDQIASRLDFDYVDLGRQRVKNVETPVRAYQVCLHSHSKALVPLPLKRWAVRLPLNLMVVLLVLLVGLLAAQRFSMTKDVPSPWSGGETPQLDRRLPHPSLLRLTVLPFSATHEEPAQLDLSQGLTQTLQTALTQRPESFVIVSQERSALMPSAGLYLLRGTTTIVNQRVRVAVYLVDATTGKHVWAEQYDQALQDMLQLQEALTRRIVQSLSDRFSSRLN